MTLLCRDSPSRMNQDDVELPVNSRGDGDHLVLPSSQGGNDVEKHLFPQPLNQQTTRVET
ncbi:hypothetical protein AO442_005168 [Nakaseomyces glabratus]|nr:hypothetical protein AO443_001410 [Nakaseomyces glabratus]KTB17455.1 hypothetical protein AO442_005033 [Nakaseomyces glabratus]KTB18626.1 hypothetical protein AO442_005168 [Nakaseomyces glabratus]